VLRDSHTGDPISLSEQHEEWIDHLYEYMNSEYNIGVLALFGSGKSSLMVIGLALYLIGLNRNYRIGIVCNSDENATKRVQAIGGYITRDKRYQEVFPEVVRAKGEQWSQHKIVVERDIIAPEGSIEACAIDSTGIGSRYDILIFDDPVDQKDSMSEAVRKSRIEKVSNTWFSRLEPGGKCVWIATRWHKHDATHEQLMRSNWRFLVQGVSEDFSYLSEPPIEYIHYPSVAHRENPKKIPLWHEKWPEEELRARAEAMGLRAFNRGYRQRPYSDEDTLFNTAKVMAAIDWNAVPERAVLDTWPRYLGADLSGEKRPGTVITVIARDPLTGKKYLVEIKRGNWGFTRKTADVIVEMFQKHKCTLGFVENNAAQETMLALIKALHGCDIALRGYTTGKNKMDPLEGLPGLAVEFENATWTFPFGKPSVVSQRNQIASSQVAEIVLIRELIGWPHEADSDCCMSLLFASRAASFGRGIGIPGIFKGTGQSRVFGEGGMRENYFQPTSNTRQFQGKQV